MISRGDALMLMAVAFVAGGGFAWAILSAVWNHGAAW